MKAMIKEFFISLFIVIAISAFQTNVLMHSDVEKVVNLIQEIFDRADAPTAST